MARTWLASAGSVDLNMQALVVAVIFFMTMQAEICFARTLSQDELESFVSLLSTGQALSDSVETAKSGATLPGFEYICLQSIEKYFDDSWHNLETFTYVAVIDKKMTDGSAADFVARKLNDSLDDNIGELGVAQKALVSATKACRNFTSVLEASSRVSEFFTSVSAAYVRAKQHFLNH